MLKNLGLLKDVGSVERRLGFRDEPLLPSPLPTVDLSTCALRTSLDGRPLMLSTTFRGLTILFVIFEAGNVEVVGGVKDDIALFCST